MKLATLKSGGRDGTLIVVNRALSHYTAVPAIARTMQYAIDHWNDISPELNRIYKALNNNQISDTTPLDTKLLAAPLPRAYQWLDGSAYLSHVTRVRKARGADMPASFQTDPLMYQGGSDVLLGPTDPIMASDENWGVDFESEVAVITNDVPMGISPDKAASHIILIALVNDISLRNLIPDELAKGFGFLQGKPPTAFSPVAVTPDELADAWRDCKVHLALQTRLNGEVFGEPNAGHDMQFSFAQLIAHAAKTRQLSAGTIIGSGTVSNEDLSKGYSCLAECRVVEKVETGKPRTPFMSAGDEVQIEMLDPDSQSIFGKIHQKVIIQQV